jgi:hypothetical protein
VELKSKIEVLDKRNKDRREAENKVRERQIEFLEYEGKHLQSYLKTVSD